VGFQNSAAGLDLGFYAARSYSPSRPPRTPAVLPRRQDQEDSHGPGGWLRLARCPVSRDRGPFGSRPQPEPVFPWCAASSCACAQASIARRWTFSQLRSGNVLEAPQSPQVALLSGIGPVSQCV